jgi:hypothetical protein
MPKIYNIDPRLLSSGLVKELPNTSMLLGGQLVDKQTLQARFPPTGDENNAVIRDWYNNGSSGMSATPYRVHVRNTNWNSPIMSCFYYLSGYFKCQSMSTDSVNGRTFYVDHGQAGPRARIASSNSTASYVSTSPNFNLNSSGPWGGWGNIRNFNQGEYHNQGGGTQYGDFECDWSVSAYDNNTENYLFTNRYTGAFGPGTALNTAVLAPYTHIVGIAQINAAGSRYYWRCPTNYWDNSPGGAVVGNNPGASTPPFSYALMPTNAGGSNTVVPATTPFMLETSNVNSNTYGTYFGPNAQVYRQFVIATATFVYYLEHTLGVAGLGNSTTSNVYFLKKVTYSGTETTIASHGAWMYGCKLPTPIFNETATSASFIYHVWGQWTGSAGAVTLNRVDINKSAGTETITAISQDAASTTAFTRIYNLLGIQTASAPVGVYNDAYWRAMAITRTWLVTGATGIKYLMMSFEHPMLNFAANSSPAIDYAVTNIMGSISLQQTYFNTTQTNANGSGFLRRDAFRIWSWILDAGYTSAAYQAETDFSALMPRWIMPVDNGNGLVQYMAHSSDAINDKVIQFDEVSDKWAVTNTMPYRCDHIGQDSIGRVWIGAAPLQGAVTNVTDTLYLEGLYIPYAINVSTFANVYTYTGAPINSNLQVSTTNFAGNLVSANVGITLSGNIVFNDGSQYRVVTTSASTVVSTNVVINGSYPTRFVANIVNLI